MKLTWLGHACFMLEHEGYRVVADPYLRVEGYPHMHAQAHAVTCSHQHLDHNGTARVELLEAESNPFVIRTVEVFHDEKGGTLRGENKIHILCAEELTVAHMGDLGHRPDASAVRRLRGCDALLIPVGGTYTVTGDEAAELTELLQPRVVIPMHYRGESFGFDEITTLEPFLSHFSEENVTFLAENTFELTADRPAGVIVPAFCV
jgi:L-ascorbate metabolism protein UlaG (beta-lactamase superfamily)